jgi:opacity protein-like surface antigen/outer membrane protease
VKAIFLGVAAFFVLLGSENAAAGPLWNWSSSYVGIDTGAVWGDTHFSDPFGPSIYGDNVRTPGYLFGGEIGRNWQAPTSRWVVGLEADLAGVDSGPGGTMTCLAFSGLYISPNCRVRPEATATFTGRVGFAAGAQGQTLLYLKGGIAWAADHVDVAVGTPVMVFPGGMVPPGASTGASLSRLGGVIGAGVEEALTPVWSVKLEYDYLGFGAVNVATPASFMNAAGVFTAMPGTTSRANQNLQEAKLGLNYHFDNPMAAPDSSSPFIGTVKAPPPPPASGWEFELGARYGYSWSRFQKDLGCSTCTTAATANLLNSRLTYNTTQNTGEVFWRIDSPAKIFFKGFAGGGSNSGGHMNDEDWNAFFGTVGYSNTLSSPVTGPVSYATVDAGFDFLTGPTYKLGGFVGYNYYRDDQSAYGCAQIANPLSDCNPPLPSSTLGIIEDDKWQSLRLGANAEFMAFPKVKVTGDAAWLPYVNFAGTDFHVLRSLVFAETGRGQGAQFEATVSYYVTPAFSVGLGGRYWAMWTNDSASSGVVGMPCPCQTQPTKVERAGMFLQASYKFGSPFLAN